jgi:hypothetical protein
MLAPLAAITILISNVAVSFAPQHAKLSQEYETGRCVAGHLAPADLYLATDWDFGDFMAYRYRRDSIDMISTIASYQLDEAKGLAELRLHAHERQAMGHAVYVTDFASYPADKLDFLKSVAHVTQGELEQAFPGKKIFACGERSFRIVDAIP